MSSLAGPRITARGQRAPRFARNVFLLLFAGGLLVVLLAAVLWILLLRPRAPAAPCSAHRQCSNPPSPEPPMRQPPPQMQSQSSLPYKPGRLWKSGVGATIRYDAKIWRTLTADPDELRLLASSEEGDRLWVTVRTVPRAEMSPLELFQDQVSREERDKLGVEIDPIPEHMLLEPSIGFVAADDVNGAYSATLDPPPSPSVKVEFMLLAATDGTATVLVEALTDGEPRTPKNEAPSPYPIFQKADALLATFAWSSM